MGKKVTKVDAMPWTGVPFGFKKYPGQRGLHARLSRSGRATLSPQAFISPFAMVFTDRLTMGETSYIAAHAQVRGKVAMGDRCSVNSFASLMGKVTLGNDVRIASHATLAGFNHGFDDLTIPIHQQPLTSLGVVVGDDVWIGAQVVVVDGVRVGSHSVLAAGAIVTKDVPEWSLVGGNPARVLGDRRLMQQESASEQGLPREVLIFGALVKQSYRKVLARCRTSDSWYVDQPGAKVTIRPNCDAVEIAALFDGQQLLPVRVLVSRLHRFQDRRTGLYREPGHRWGEKPSFDQYKSRYPAFAAGYALELLGSELRSPLRVVETMTTDQIVDLMKGLDWARDAWGAGDWLDTLFTFLHFNQATFQSARNLDPVWSWLDSHQDPDTGLWGSATEEAGLLQPVNGFYRLVRGSYFQWGRTVGYPERAIDSLLAHGQDSRHFRDDKGDACNVLDLVWSLWFLRRQSDRRADEVRGVAQFHLRRLLKKWVPEQGFSFDLESHEGSKGRCGLKGTEMGLTIVYYCADLLGLADRLGYIPRGVHRPWVPERLSPRARP